MKDVHSKNITTTAIEVNGVGKKVIRLYFTHPAMVNGKLESVGKMIPLDKDKFYFVWDEFTPQYIFGGELIYTNRRMRSKFIELVRKNPEAVTIFFAGEAVVCDFNIFDYALVFDRELKFGDRVFRHPTYGFFHESIYQSDNDMKYERAKEEYGRRKFCCFIYSNGNAHYKRDELFYTISKYKRVDSLGRHLNNTKGGNLRGENWRKSSIDAKSNYRFSIAAENAVVDGYTSEKILTSFQAHSIPIYFGDPSIEKEFNSTAFINANNYSSEDELLHAVRKIDADEELWCRMAMENWRTDKQVIKQKTEQEDYRKFVNHIFEQDIDKAKRRGQGTHPEIYNNFFTNAKTVRQLTLKSIIRKAKNIWSEKRNQYMEKSEET